MCVCLHETVFLATRACLYVRAYVCCVWIFAIVCLSKCVTVCAVCLSVCACERICGFVCVCVCVCWMDVAGKVVCVLHVYVLVLLSYTITSNIMHRPSSFDPSELL